MSDTEKLILHELKSMKEFMQIFVPDLSIEKEVIHFLGKDKRTFKKYLDEGTLINGVHYVNDKDKKIYIPKAIIEFKKSGCRKTVTNPTAQKVLESILK